MMNDELKAACIQFIIHHSAFIIALLCLFQPCVFLDELLLAEAGEADEEFGRVARAFAAQDEAAAVLGVPDVHAGREASACGRCR
jgi:hypothetical protein